MFFEELEKERLKLLDKHEREIKIIKHEKIAAEKIRFQLFIH